MKTISFPKAGSFDSCLSYFKDLATTHKLAIQNLGQPASFFESVNTTPSGALTKEAREFTYQNPLDKRRYSYLVTNRVEYLKKLFFFYNIQIDWDTIVTELEGIRKSVKDTLKTQLKSMDKSDRQNYKRFANLSIVRIQLEDIAFTVPLGSIVAITQGSQIQSTFPEAVELSVLINNRPNSVFTELKKANIEHSEWSLLDMVENDSLDQLKLKTPEIDLSGETIETRVVVRGPTYEGVSHNWGYYYQAYKWAVPVNWLLADETLTESEGRQWLLDNAAKGLRLNYLPTSITHDYLHEVVSVEDFLTYLTRDYYQLYHMLDKVLSDDRTGANMKYRDEFTSQFAVLNYLKFKQDSSAAWKDYLHCFFGSLTLFSFLRRDMSLEDTHLSGLESYRSALVGAAGSDKHHVFESYLSVFLDTSLLFSEVLPYIYQSEVKLTRRDFGPELSHSFQVDAPTAAVKFSGAWGETLRYVKTVVELKDLRFFEVVNMDYYHDTHRFRYRTTNLEEYTDWGYSLYTDSDVYNYLDAGRMFFTGEWRTYSKMIPYGDLKRRPDFILFHNDDAPDLDTFSLSTGQYSTMPSPLTSIETVFNALTGVALVDLPSTVQKFYLKEFNKQKREQNKNTINSKINERTQQAFTKLVDGDRDEISFNDVTYYKDSISYQNQLIQVSNIKLRTKEYKNYFPSDDFTVTDIEVDSPLPFNDYLLRVVNTRFSLLSINFDQILDLAMEMIQTPHRLVTSRKFLESSYFKKNPKIKERITTTLYEIYNSNQSDLSVTLTMTMGDVTFEVLRKEKLSKVGNRQTHWYVCGNKLNQADVSTVLNNALCFANISDFERYVKSVRQVPLKYQKLIESGVTFTLHDTVFQLFNTPLSLKIDRHKSTNYLVHQGKEYRIRNSAKFFRLVTKSQVSREQEGIKYASFELNEFLNIVLDSDIVDGFPASELHNLITDAISRYVNTIVGQRKAIAQVEKTFKLQYGSWTMDDGKRVTGYQINGKLATYIIQFNKTKSLTSINPMVYDYPTGKYRCMIDKASSLTPVGALVNRVYALHNDSMLSSQINTLTD